MESRAIAAALEQAFPSPPLHLDSPILPKVETLMPKIMPALSPIYAPRVLRDILNDRSIYYFKKTREEKFGMPLDEFEKSDKGGEKAWENAEPHLSELAKVLKENGGPFFMGETVSYADFIVVGFFQFLKRISYDDDIVGRALQIDPSFLVLYEACPQWLKRDDC
jgi:glutathione S-transferase